jgi:hypothetical protein
MFGPSTTSNPEALRAALLNWWLRTGGEHGGIVESSGTSPSRRDARRGPMSRQFFDRSLTMNAEAASHAEAMIGRRKATTH